LRRNPPPASADLLSLLEAILEKLSISIRRESLNSDGRTPFSVGGLCRIRGQKVMLIDPSVPEEQTVALLFEALKTLDLSDVYLPPSIRDRLERPDSLSNPE